MCIVLTVGTIGANDNIVISLTGLDGTASGEPASDKVYVYWDAVEKGDIIFNPLHTESGSKPISLHPHYTRLERMCIEQMWFKSGSGPFHFQSYVDSIQRIMIDICRQCIWSDDKAQQM